MASFLRTFLKNFMWVLSSSIVNVLFSFFASLFVLLNLSVFDYGLMALAISASNIVGLFYNFGLSAVVGPDIAQELGEKKVSRAKKILISYSKINIIMSVLLSLVFLLGSDIISQQYQRPELAGLMLAVSLLILLTGLRNLVRSTYETALMFKYSSFMGMIEPISRFGLVLGFLFFDTLSPYTALLCYAFSVGFSLVVGLIFFSKPYNLYKGVEASKENLLLDIIKKHGKYAILRGPFLRIKNDAPPWIIEFVLGVEAVGLYSLASKITSYVRTLLEALDKVLIPTFSYELGNNKERVKRAFIRGIKYGGFISTIVVIIAIIFIGDFLDFVGLDKYLPSIPLARILLLSLIIFGFTYPLRPLLFAFKAQRQLTYAFIVRASTVFAFGIALTSLMQSPAGMAIAVLLSSIAENLFDYFLILRIDKSFKINPREILSIDDYDRRLFARLVKAAKNRGKTT